MPSPRDKTREEIAYEEMFGRPPSRLPEDHPDVWQWEWERLSREERDRRLAGMFEEQPKEQESLF